MNKDILIQYCDLKEEVKDLRKRISNLETQIGKIETEGEVIDTVRGGEGGIQHFKIMGFPYPEYSRKKTRLYLNKAQLENSELELLETLSMVEEYIQSIGDSRMRRIIRHRFLDSDNPTWVQVAMRIGGKTTDESVRKEFDRFMESK